MRHDWDCACSPELGPCADHEREALERADAGRAPEEAETDVEYRAAVELGRHVLRLAKQAAGGDFGETRLGEFLEAFPNTTIAETVDACMGGIIDSEARAAE